jgi:class 3 adenylate cyclase
MDERGAISNVAHAFQTHLRIYLVVVAFLVVIWALSGAGYFWPAWPAVGWGLGVAIHGVVARSKHPAASTALPVGTPRVSHVDWRGETQRARETDRPSTHRRWVTVMFTDIANSTSLTEALGDAEWSRFLARYRETIRVAFRDRGGTEVGSQGDGMLARFSSPANAVLCAVDIQRKHDEMREGAGLVPHVRIGIHAGEAVEDEGDLIGRVVNLAARVTAEAAPGEILVTEPVADELAGRIEVVDRGLRSLKGVPQPRHLLAVRWA